MALWPQTRITAKVIHGRRAAERTSTCPKRVHLAALCIFFCFPQLNCLGALRKELYEEQHPQMTHPSAVQVGRCRLSRSEGCGLAGGTLLLPIPPSLAVQPVVGQTGSALPVHPPAMPVLTLRSETFLWENPDLVEQCLWDSPGQRLVRTL